MLCFSSSISAPIIHSKPSLIRSVSMLNLNFAEKTCTLTHAPVDPDLRHGLTRLNIDTNRLKIERDIDSPIPMDPILFPAPGDSMPSMEPDPLDPDVGTGYLLGQTFLIDSCDLLAERQQRSRSTKTHAAPAATLEKWHYLFEQVYLAEKNPRENLDNLILFKTSLAEMNIDHLSLSVHQVAPILMDDQRKSDLLTFHRLFGGKNYFKALFLTVHGLAPTELEGYNYFREKGFGPERAVTMAVNQKNMSYFTSKHGFQFFPQAGDFSLL